MPHADPEVAKAYRKAYKQRPETKARDKAYRDVSKDKFKTYREVHKEEIAARMRAWRQANKEHCKEYKRRYEQDTHREQHLAQRQSYRDKNRDRLRGQFRMWVESSPKYKEWIKNNPDKIRTYSALSTTKRYARFRDFYKDMYGVLGSRSHHASNPLLHLKWELCDQTCYICGEFLAESDINLDHVIPIERGTNEAENLMPVHRICNRRKSNKLDYPLARPDLVWRTSGLPTPRIEIRWRTDKRWENGVMMQRLRDHGLV